MLKSKKIQTHINFQQVVYFSECWWFCKIPSKEMQTIIYSLYPHVNVLRWHCALGVRRIIKYWFYDNPSPPPVAFQSHSHNRVWMKKSRTSAQFTHNQHQVIRLWCDERRVAYIEPFSLCEESRQEHSLSWGGKHNYLLNVFLPWPRLFV